mgnify:CR=1 FL=1
MGEWCGADGSEALPGFREFAMKQVGGVGQGLFRGAVPGHRFWPHPAARCGLLCFCVLPPALLPPRPTPTCRPHPACARPSTTAPTPHTPQFGGEVLLEALVAGGVDIRDAAAISLLTEVAQSLQLVHQRCGEAYLSYLCTALLPSMGWPAEASQQLVAHITGSQPKALKDFLKVALQQLRQQQQQQAAANGRR